MTYDGNQYEIEELDGGIITFRHVQTRELLHGSVGAAREARDLYIGSSALLFNPKPTLIAFDVGMGCGAQLLALLDFLASTDAQCTTLRVFSFDLEKDGLRAVLAAGSRFPDAHRHRDHIEQFIQNDHATVHFEGGKTLEWQFIRGDFRHTVLAPLAAEKDLKVDAIFYDFFSPASHPWLWTFDLFEKLHRYCAPATRLVTYSSATCVKAALAASGWFVGQTISSGKKAKSIVAAGALEELSEPLPAQFLSTFEKSHKPFCDTETEENKKIIVEKMRTHPQFVKRTPI